MQISSAPKTEGAGKAGCALHPRSHVHSCTKENAAHEHTGSAETLRPSPRNGSTTYTCSPWRPGFACHHHPEKRQLLRDLTPTLGRRDHTISPHAACASFARKPTSTATCPDVSDDGRRPLLAGQDAATMAQITIAEKQNIFSAGAGHVFADLPAGLLCRTCGRNAPLHDDANHCAGAREMVEQR